MFFALVRVLPWDGLLQRYLEELFTRYEHPWPLARDGIEHRRTGRGVRDRTRHHDAAPRPMAQPRFVGRPQAGARFSRGDDRTVHGAAGPAGCRQRREHAGASVAARGAAAPVVVARRSTSPRQISRTNARAMLISLCHFLRKAGAAGLLLTIDLRAATRKTDAGVRYSPSAVMDLYEVLRELIDDLEHLPGLFILGLADQGLISGDPPADTGYLQGVGNADLAGRAAGRSAKSAGAAGDGEPVNLEARTAIEALRAGVPNRAAVRLMGTEESALEHAFDEQLHHVWRRSSSPGLGVAGGFGAGKSHFLGYLAEVGARAELRRQPCGGQQGNAAVRSRAGVRGGRAGGDVAGPSRRRDHRCTDDPAPVARQDGGAGNRGRAGGRRSGADIFRAAVSVAAARRLPAGFARQMERFLAGGKIRPAGCATGARGGRRGHENSTFGCPRLRC